MNPPSLKQSASDFVTLLNSQNIKAKFDQMRKDQVQSEFNAALYPYADSVPPSVVDSTAAGLIGGVSLQNNQSMDGIALQNNPSVGGLSLQNNPSMAGISLQNNPSISGISLRNNPIDESPQHLGQSLNDLRLNHATTVDAASSSAFACDLNDDVFAPKTAAATVSPHSLLSFSASKMPSPTPANSPYHSMDNSVDPLTSLIPALTVQASPPLLLCNDLCQQEPAGRRSRSKIGGIQERRRCRLQSRRNASAGLSVKDQLEVRRLREAVQAGDAEKVDGLVAEGIDVSTADEKGRTALHFASAKGHLRMVETLIKAGADVNKLDHIGNTPLHLASCTNKLPVVTLLIKSGSDVSKMDRCGRTALHLARSRLLLLRHSKNLSPLQIDKEFLELVDLMETYSKRPSPFVAERLDHALNDLCSALSSLPLGRTTAGSEALTSSLTATLDSSLNLDSSSNPNSSSLNTDPSTHNAVDSTPCSFHSSLDQGPKPNPELDIPSQMDAILEQFDRTCSLLGS